MKRRSDYEWHYHVGGNCGLRRRKTGELTAIICHVEQGVYEALINRRMGQNKSLQKSSYISVGVFNDSNEAQNQIETILGDIWEK